MLPIALCEDSRWLFLKASKIVADLSVIVPEDISTMQVGEYPAIEALAFAVCELQDDSRWRPQREQRRYETPTYMRPLGL